MVIQPEETPTKEDTPLEFLRRQYKLRKKQLTSTKHDYDDLVDECTRLKKGILVLSGKDNLDDEDDKESISEEELKKLEDKREKAKQYRKRYYKEHKGVLNDSDSRGDES